MTNKDIQRLIDRFLEGETTVGEEALLARYLLGDDIPAEWVPIRLMLGSLAMDEAEYDNIIATRKRHRRRLALGWAAAAACVVAVLLQPQQPPSIPPKGGRYSITSSCETKVLTLPLKGERNCNLTSSSETKVISLPLKEEKNSNLTSSNETKVVSLPQGGGRSSSPHSSASTNVASLPLRGESEGASARSSSNFSPPKGGAGGGFIPPSGGTRGAVEAVEAVAIPSSDSELKALIEECEMTLLEMDYQAEMARQRLNTVVL